MFRMEISIPPEAASRPEFVPEFKRAILRPKYRNYKERLTELFNEYADNEELIDIMRNSKYGIDLKVIFKFDNTRNHSIFKRQRPDLDNLVKATIDALFDIDSNKELVGYKKDYLGREVPEFKQIVDDSNIVHFDLTKINVDPEEVGQTIILGKILEEDIERR